MPKAIRSDNTIKFFISAIGIVVIGYTLKELSHIFIPFVIAYFMFFIFSPLNNFLMKIKIPQVITILLNILISGFVLWIAFDFILDSFIRFSDEAPYYANRLSKTVRALSVSIGIRDPYFTRFSIEKMIQKIDYKELAGGIFSSTMSLAGTVLYLIFFFVFVVIGHNTIYEAIKRRFVSSGVKTELKKIERDFKHTIEEHPDEEEILVHKLDEEKHVKEEKLATMFRSITEQIQRYIIAKVLINIVAAAAVYGALAYLEVDFPLIWALLTFLFNFIPTIGSAAALILPVLMALIQYESVSFAFLTAAVLGFIQTLAFNVAEPAIVGKRLNLNPLLILFSVLVWGYIWGIVGMLLSVPLTAIIKIIISNSESENLRFISDIMSKE